ARGLDISGLPFVINVTLPDNAADYIHRVGRVGRADAMGLAISIIGSAPEKVWYHTCKTKGKGCLNRRLRSEGGCCIWYDEPDCLRQIEERLQQTVTSIGADCRFPGFQPGVVYGRRKGDPSASGILDGHSEFLSRALADVSHLEEVVQRSFWAWSTRHE
ncbi:MAG: helicase-related protein, partial [archaeon]|nr:helicase-related protein [archaeon]